MTPLLLALDTRRTGAAARVHRDRHRRRDAHRHARRRFALARRRGQPARTARDGQGAVSLRPGGAGRCPALPSGSQLITAGGDRIPGSVSGGDAKVVQFRPAVGE